jgi:hypothetical protein
MLNVDSEQHAMLLYALNLTSASGETASSVMFFDLQPNSLAIQQAMFHINQVDGRLDDMNSRRFF